MRAWMTGRTLNERLARILLALGLLAIFASPYRGGRAVVDAKELALAVDTQADHVDALDLADWIIERRSDYRLVDTRTEAEFQGYHIPGAENITVAGLADAPFGRHEKIVLYSDGGIHSVQAWLLLRAMGFKGVYILKGGLQEWTDQVVFPALSENPTPAERTRDERLKYVSAFFGGKPRTGGAAGPAGPPTLNLPAAPAGGGVAGTKVPARKKKEGC